jgi:glycosyltransferase involved in cell wall biosynthesis
MINILYMLETGGPGGAETVLLNVVSNLNRKEFRPYVVLLKKGWAYERLKEVTDDIYIIPSRRGYDLSLIVKIYRFIRGNNIHVVNSHLKDMNVYSSIAARLVGVPHVAVEHGNVHLGPLSLQKKVKIKLTNTFTTKYIAISRYTRGKLRDIIGNDRKIEVIYNGVQDRTSQKAVNKSDIGFNREDFLVLNLANLYPVKNHKSLIRVAKRVVETEPRARFLIAGRGEMEGELLHMIHELGLDEHVILLGYRSDAERFLSACDVYLQTSVSEGLPVSVIEAMSHGKPVVATDVGGTAELIDTILVEPDDVETMAEKLLTLIRDRNFRERLGEENYLKYKKMFTINTMASEYEQLYKSLVSEETRARYQGTIKG